MTNYMSLSNNWAITKLKVVDTSLTWTIQNFSYNMTKVGHRLHSPTFSVEEACHKWCLDLYPNGETNPDYVGLYIHLKDSNHTAGMVKYQFSILNHRGVAVYQMKWSELCEIEPGSAWGYDKFLAKATLFDNAAIFLPNDSLTILCEIKISAGSSATSGQCKIKEDDSDSLYKPELDLSTNLFELYKTSNHSDVAIITNEKKFLVHKSILSARSSFFQELLKTATKSDIHLDAIKINYFSTDIIDEVLRYIYSGNVNNLSLHATNLLAAAKKFNLPGLMILCENNFIKGLNVLNVSSVLLMADLHTAEKLKEKAIKFIISNLQDVYNTPGYDLLKMSNPKLISEIFNIMAKDFNAVTNLSDESKNKKKRSHNSSY